MMPLLPLHYAYNQDNALPVTLKTYNTQVLKLMPPKGLIVAFLATSPEHRGLSSHGSGNPRDPQYPHGEQVSHSATHSIGG